MAPSPTARIHPTVHNSNPNYLFSELDSLATNSVMLPIRGGSLLLGTGQRVILHHLSRREEDAPVQNDDLDGNRVAPLQLSLTWCGMKMEVQKKHAFIAPRWAIFYNNP